MQIAVSHIPTTPERALELARLAEEVGIGTFGIADSSHLFGAMYPIVQHILGHTESLRCGPCVTNPVTRHSSVHAADVAALETLFPGRLLMAMGAGDSAVHSVGLRPAKADAIRDAIVRVRDVAGQGPDVFMAASGPKAAGSVPPQADGILLGGGLDPGWLARLGGLADESAGRKQRRWVFMSSHVVASDADTEAARESVESSVVALSRHALHGALAERGVPDQLVAGIQELHSRYVFGEHARVGGENARILKDYPVERDYLLDRFSLVGTPEGIAERLRSVEATAGIEGAILSTTLTEPRGHIRLIGERLIPLLRGDQG